LPAHFPQIANQQKDPCLTAPAKALQWPGQPRTPEPPMPAPLVTVGLLILSNLFMTFAWYGHLKFKGTALWVVILVSWGIAFFEYLLQVPANRIGHGALSAAQLKTIQEVISLTIFALFSWLYLGERMGWTGLAGFALIALGAGLVFLDR
jgi:hypothetical protein